MYVVIEIDIDVAYQKLHTHIIFQKYTYIF